ncbi:uncharacterized protein N0V89_007010 [Didymosphaeria variabile]|uniref:C3H1-type domain-containing protein n=1 Tax=Didymosphaeria variabile TaxID=1932322 RepID=A0A9W8XIQ4_9PLEO|nr:uncharacterized protein N0V89_007010 [Didymosphaeria variabile]KAJ4351667.1 hypothetical protein N0V89_007010 [Didymosphaeria variabile]
MPPSSASSSPSVPAKKRKAGVFDMEPDHRGHAKRPRTPLSNSTAPQSSADKNADEHKMLLIEYSSWEEKQQVELKQLRSTVALLSKEIADMREERSAKKIELQNAHQHNKSLELEKDNLHKKCDSISRRADRWESAHNDLKPKLQESEAQINKLVNEKHQAIATVLQEQSRNIEKNKEVRNLNRELNALAKSYQDLHNVLNATQRNGPATLDILARHASRGGIPGGCKRVKCQFWTKDTCPKLRCGLAHEDDGLPVVVEHRKLKQKATPIPAEVAETLNTPALPLPALAAAVVAPVSGPPTLQDMSAKASTKKHGRDDGNATQGNGSTKRAKLNTAAQHANHSNESTAASIERKDSNITLDSNDRKARQAHTVQEEQHFDPMEQDSDPNDWVGDIESFIIQVDTAGYVVQADAVPYIVRTASWTYLAGASSFLEVLWTFEKPFGSQVQ